jgi:hypothetical protein
VGRGDGTAVGFSDGPSDGPCVGDEVGTTVGVLLALETSIGASDGDLVGSPVGGMEVSARGGLSAVVAGSLLGLTEPIDGDSVGSNVSASVGTAPSVGALLGDFTNVGACVGLGTSAGGMVKAPAITMYVGASEGPMASRVGPNSSSTVG